MLNEDELKNELARRLISRFFSNEKSFEENLKNAEFEEGFLKNLANQLLKEVEEVGVGGKEKKETNRQTEKEEDLDGKSGIRAEILVAEILIEALPYIQEFYGKTVVVKYGGNAMINDELKEKVMQDIALMKYTGINVVIVHGGGPEITGFLKKLGKETSFVSGLRVTDEETVEIAEMVLAGKINSEIVMLLNRRGVRAVGISGKDADLIHAEKKLATVYEQGEKTKVDIGYVGKTKKIDIRIVKDLISSGYVPVIAPIGVGEDGESYNINADYVAADIAGALKAEKLLLLTDTEGVYKDFNDKSSFISSLSASEAREYIKSGVIVGGMVPKVEACLRALQSGTGKAHIIDGRLSHSIILELFTASGIGTQVE
ncbi:MAG: acetylglutamate kinase [Selenomonadaceae bacterium]|nr:acetylglutamate kinase [Selenomonadaceae bacterium]